MNAEYKELNNAFQAYFKNYKGESGAAPRFNEGECWINCPVERAGTDDIHYELLNQGNDFFIEFHVETPARFVSRWKSLREALDGDKRHFFHYTWYSSNYWRSRYPVINSHDVSEDLAYMVEIIKHVFANSPDDANSASPPSAFEALPFQKNPKEVANMLDDDTLHLPAVQRGKVWNAARIETLWDSIFRGFSIGALLCVQKKNGEKRFDLLDGQQRSNAIAIAYDSFPPKQMASSILWIDVGPKENGVLAGQKKFAFCVTTPSQPWGYGDSSDETRNSLLSASQKRAAINILNDSSQRLTWHNENEKPWPGELFPYNTECAVPFPLLREFMENWGNAGKAGCPSFEDFLSWCSVKMTAIEGTAAGGNHWWNWLKMLNARKASLKPWQWDDIIAKTDDDRIGRIKQLESYSIAFLDAGSIGEDEVSVYFTRIGRGGVRPSDEELAYSVLKSHLGDEFRNKIESIHERHGLAQPSRIAHLAVRCFRSAKTDGGTTTFCSSPVLEEAIKMCKSVGSRTGASEKSVGMGGKEEFLNYVCGGDFDHLLTKVSEVVFGTCGLTRWHRTRYCQYSNGDIFLFLLLAIRDNLFDSDLLVATAEWIYEKASHPAQAIRFILTEGLCEGLAHSMRETYYGASRLWTPVLPSVIDKVVHKSVEAAQSKLDSNEFSGTIRQMSGNFGIAELITTGYNSQQAYGMLLYACRSVDNKRFDYDRNSGVWAEDNCPWDYDHILPHSWIDRMDGEFSDICQWLKNSLGNLAPLSFEMNRSLSDTVRDHLYPYCGKPERETQAVQIQKDYCIDGAALDKMREFAQDSEAQRAFVVGTLCRFSELYKKWYYGLKFNKLLAFQNDNGYGNAEVIRRRKILETLTQRPNYSGFSLRYYSADEKRMPIGMLHESDTDWFVWDWVSVFMEKGRYAIELSIDRKCQQYEIGIARLTVGDAETLDDRTIESLSKFDSTIWTRPKDDQYWHVVHKDEVHADKTDDEVVDVLAAQLDALQQAVS